MYGNNIKLNVDPGLVQLTGGLGNGFAAFGNALANIGELKVKRAQEQALKNEQEAKTRVAQSAQRDKNSILAPKATAALQQRYGISANSPLSSSDAPTIANQNLGLIDLPKESPKKYKSHANGGVFDEEGGKWIKEPNAKNVVVNGDKLVNAQTGEVVKEYDKKSANNLVAFSNGAVFDKDSQKWIKEPKQSSNAQQNKADAKVNNTLIPVGEIGYENTKVLQKLGKLVKNEKGRWSVKQSDYLDFMKTPEYFGNLGVNN